jgi:acyl transferase domain-containing protein
MTDEVISNELNDSPLSDEAADHIAVVGVAGRFPESPNIETFWDNVRHGRDCLHTFTDDELDALGIPASRYNQPNFVRRGTRLPNMDAFDAAFFGLTPREAATLDPQSRLFLETSYLALESAGFDPFAIDEPVGVFAGCNPNDYALLLGVADPTDSLGAFDQMIGTDRDFLATRVAHRLGLRGPAMTVQTACSTSLVAVHMAVQSLLNYECSIALAGGVSVNLRQGVGYFAQPGMILSPTGVCRAFDANADGTTLGQGVGAVALKRLTDAYADGDPILAVVRATAINNDGSEKLSYTAPSENGQAEVITTAHELAGVTSDTITYVETHGTATKLGDPVEIAALTRAFAPGTERTGYCAIGSAKTNFGHTDAAAGITGFIKAVLSLNHAELPPSANFSAPNPDIDFANSPFFVNTELTPWPAGPTPRRAGVSAFGIGGTNAHVVLEEAPVRQPAPDPVERPYVFTFAGHKAEAVDRLTAAVAETLTSEPTMNIAAVAGTLRRARSSHRHRRAVVASSLGDAAQALLGASDTPLIRGTAGARPTPLVWLFTGQGAQHPRMGAGLYAAEPAFREAFDTAAAALAEPLGLDLAAAVLESDDAEALRQTQLTQPALFAVEYATAQLMRSWGLEPAAVVGHSVGEYAAAVVAGVMSLRDGALLVAQRGALMASMTPGAMLAIGMPSAQLDLPPGVELAAANGAALSVVAGPHEHIDAYATALEAKELPVQRLATSHAFHSEMMTEAADRFAEVVGGVVLSPPKIAMASNVTGTWLTPEEAVSPAFWASQIRKPVLFERCIDTVLEVGPSAFLEVGPGRTLATFVRVHERFDRATMPVATALRHPASERDDQTVALEAVAQLWTGGINIDWDRIDDASSGPHADLPGYQFVRERAWAPEYHHVLALPGYGVGAPGTAEAPVERKPIDEWLYAPSWSRRPRPAPQAHTPGSTTVLLAPASNFGDYLVQMLGSMAAANGDTFVVVRAGADAPAASPSPESADYEVDPATDDLEDLFAKLGEQGVVPDRVVHAWLAEPTTDTVGSATLDAALDLGVHAAHSCARAISRLVPARGPGADPVDLVFVTSGAASVMGTELVRPAVAALEGPAKVIPLEYPDIRCRLIDIENSPAAIADPQHAVGRLADELLNPADEPMVALRGLHTSARWVPGVAPLPDLGAQVAPPIRHGGTFLIVGGLGGVGLSIAQHLADNYNAKLALTSRQGRPVAATDAQSEETDLRLVRLAEIEASAPEVLVLAADITDLDQMRKAVEQAEAQLGHIDGVIVAAGVADQEGAIHRRTRERARAAIASKVHGTIVVAELFAHRKPDFVLYSSSIAATLFHNRFAQVGYVTGNTFVEAFAERSRADGFPATTVAWDDWLEIGMSVRAAADFSDRYDADIDLVDQLHSFSPQDGVQLFERALRAYEPRIIVSTTDLSARIVADTSVISPFLEQARGSGAESAEAADSEATLSEQLERVWADLLGFDDFGPADDFFELGGDSLQAARMADRLSRSLGVDLPLNVVFDHPTLGGLATAIEGVGLLSPDSAGGDEGDELGRWPLGPGQLRFLQRGAENPDHFNVSVLLEAEEPIDADRVEAALNVLMAENEVLRSRIVFHDGVPVEQVSVPFDECGFALERVSTPTNGASVPWESHAESVQAGLNLADGPVLRAALYDTGSDQRLLLCMHHLMSDRVSLLLLVDRLNELYEGGGETSAYRATSYGAWVSELAEFATGPSGADAAGQWNDQHWDRTARLPVDQPGERSDNRNDSGDAVRIELRDELARNLLSNPAGDIDEVLLLGLGRAVADWTNSDTALIETLGHGRRLGEGALEVSRSIGFFLTYSPTLVDARSDTSAADAIEALRAQAAHGWTYDAVRFYNPGLLADDLPRAEVLFNFVGKTIQATAKARFTTSADARGADTDPNGLRDHLVAVMAEVVGDNAVDLVVVFSTAFHTRETMELLAGRLQRHLEELAMARTT